MERKALLTALIITVLTGCKINQACEAYSQCDELYISDYNCDLQPRILTTPQYPYNSAPVRGVYGYPTYYYNTVYIDNCCDVPTSPPVTNLPRPSIYHNGNPQSGGNAVENNQTTIHRKPQKDAPSSRKTRD